jgi:RNA polymerase sigma factor (sigma-70 family)
MENSDFDLQNFLDELILGSSNAWRKFIQLYNPVITGTANFFAKGFDPEDITQKVILKCLDQNCLVLRNFQGNSKTAFFVYIKEIARFISLAESKKYKREIFPENEFWQEDILSAYQSAHTLYEQSEFQKNWENSLMLLDENQREVLNFLSLGYTHQQIAEIMKISINTILSWSSRGKKKLKKILDKDALLQ